MPVSEPPIDPEGPRLLPSNVRRAYYPPVLNPVLHHTDTQAFMGKTFDLIRSEGAKGGKAS